MALIKSPFISGQAAGKFGGDIYFRRRASRSIAADKVDPSNPNTSEQSANRALHSFFTEHSRKVLTTEMDMMGWNNRRHYEGNNLPSYQYFISWYKRNYINSAGVYMIGDISDNGSQLIWYNDPIDGWIRYLNLQFFWSYFADPALLIKIKVGPSPNEPVWDDNYNIYGISGWNDDTYSNGAPYPADSVILWFESLNPTTHELKTGLYKFNSCKLPPHP